MRIFLALGAAAGGLAVAAGAFGSHALREVLNEKALAAFETGVRYQIYHALALGLVGSLGSSPWLVAAGSAFGLGILLFSGSLYALSLTGIRFLGAITPLGGVAFLVGWGCLLAYGLRQGET